MKNVKYYFLMAVLSALFSSCAAIGGIFKAGMVWGIVLVVGVVGLIFYFISKSGK